MHTHITMSHCWSGWGKYLSLGLCGSYLMSWFLFFLGCSLLLGTRALRERDVYSHLPSTAPGCPSRYETYVHTHTPTLTRSLTHSLIRTGMCRQAIPWDGWVWVPSKVSRGGRSIVPVERHEGTWPYRWGDKEIYRPPLLAWLFPSPCQEWPPSPRL